MSELSIAELDSENAELLPQRETLSVIIVDASSTAIAAHSDSRAISINKVDIDNSFNTYGHSHHMHEGPP